MKLLLVLLLLLNAQAAVILIDPGHGGEEHGATKDVLEKRHRKKKKVTVYEKDLALSLAKKVKKYLQDDHQVFLTRSLDRTVGLDQRADMADLVKADLFISLHFNSSTDLRSHGFETYYLDNHDDAAVKRVEEIENKDLKGSELVVNQILIDLIIQKTVKSSKLLANLVHEHIGNKTAKKYRLRDRGVRGGLFYVLAMSKRPAILVEAGFVSHPKEVWKLRTKKYLLSYAQDIASGVKEYLNVTGKAKLPMF